MPTRTVGPDGATIDLGGRRLLLRAHAPAHTHSDLSMLDPDAGLLFPADLLFVGRVPSLDGSLPGWLAELDALEALGARSAVPGHGPALVEPAAAIAPLRRYLTTLRDDVRARDRRGPDARRGHRDRRPLRARQLGALRRLQWTKRHAGL